MKIKDRNSQDYGTLHIDLHFIIAYTSVKTSLLTPYRTSSLLTRLGILHIG
jgi:hypothetical protein